MHLLVYIFRISNQIYGRSFFMNITRGKIVKAQKVVIYGAEGIGKSTFASQFPNPVFIDTEGSTNNMDVARMDKPTSWEMLKNQITYVRDNKVCDTLIIDTIDWAEQLCIIAVCNQHQKKGIEDFGYGSGYVYEREEFGKFLNLLEEIINVGVNVVLTAHAQMRKFSQPDEIGEYDRWELKLGKKTGSQISPLVKEWADMVLFANYKTIAVATDKNATKYKAQGNRRVMYTQHHACWDAKNRHNLSDELPFEYSAIAHIFSKSNTSTSINTNNSLSKSVQADSSQTIRATVKTPVQAKFEPSMAMPDELKNLYDLMAQNSVTEQDIQLAVSQRGYFPIDTPISNYPLDFVGGCLVAGWQSVLELINQNKILPFEDFEDADFLELN